MARMESLIGLVSKIQRACTVLGDHGGEGMSLWEALSSVAVGGGLSSGKFYVLESGVGRDFLPRGSDFRRIGHLTWYQSSGSRHLEVLRARYQNFSL
ncbi:hypothetical protein DCAR_0831127 [Daucus carota subsp. sativus]|uniref:Uncharacterized protein n=1 Tax=Daucus carota subsp. sativus TaxID=79200 RepID=A0AAF0XR10_DAUCS|nr:hypothetical protein DCAR_0831127 [Daucus carota subsp. sativus]